MKRALKEHPGIPPPIRQCLNLSFKIWLYLLYYIQVIRKLHVYYFKFTYFYFRGRSLHHILFWLVLFFIFYFWSFFSNLIIIPFFNTLYTLINLKNFDLYLNSQIVKNQLFFIKET